jgi:hypothetical protein
MIFDRIFLDMDGVLADFDLSFFQKFGITTTSYEEKYGSVAFWEAIYESPNFFLELPPFVHTQQLFNLCNSIAKTVILSSPSKVNTPLCVLQKRQWVDKWLGHKVSAIFEVNKEKYASPTRLLIDDTQKKMDKWLKAGGIGHLFKNYSECEIYLKSLINGTN